MLTLGSELAAAQDLVSRRPLVEVTTSSPVPEIPFTGQDLTGSETDEAGPDVITTSEGRIALAYVYSTSIRYAYTDVNRQTYTHIDLTTTGTVTHVSILELSDGNIGVVYCAYDGSGAYIRTQVVTPTGAVVTGETTVETWAAADVLHGADVLMLSEGTAGSGGDEFGAATEQDIKTGGDGAKSYGWNVLNSANASAIDVHTTNSGKLTIAHNTANTNFDSGTFSGPFVYKEIAGDFDIEIDGTGSNPNSNYESVALIARDPAASAGEDWIRIAFFWNGSVGVLWSSTTNNVTSSGSAGGTNHRFMRITRYGNVFTVYSKLNSGDGWTQRAQYTRSDFGSTIQVGIGANTVNTTGDLVAQVEYFRSNPVDASYLMVYGITDTGTGVYLKKNTSSNFASWAGSSNISISGLSTAAGYVKGNPKMLMLGTGEVLLFYDYVEAISGQQTRVNIHRSISTNNGVSWGATAQVTTYPDYTASGYYPSPTQTAAGTIKVAYYEKRQSLSADASTTGWDILGDDVCNIGMDTVQRKLYVVCNRNPAGWHYCYGIVKIDIDTWTVEDEWGPATTPAIPSPWTNTGGPGVSFRQFVGDGPYIGVWAGQAMAMVNGETDTVTEFHFTSTYGTVNISGGADITTSFAPRSTRVVASENRCYIVWMNDTDTIFGYLDLTETGPTYTWTQLFKLTGTHSATDFFGGDWVGSHIAIEDDLIVMSSNTTLNPPTYTPKCLVFQISTGTKVKDYDSTTDSNFPAKGIRSCYHYAGKVYGSIEYNATYDPDKKGVLVIDLATDAMQYLLPTFATRDDYLIYNWTKTESNVLLGASAYGIVKFDPAAGTWDIVDHSTAPGWHPTSDNDVWNIAYDVANQSIIVGDINPQSAGFWSGVIYVPMAGDFRLPMIAEGTGSGSSWSWGAPTDLVVGFRDDSPAIVKDPLSSGIYAYWAKLGSSSLWWGFESSTKEITDYLVDGEDISIRRTIDGAPNKLEFTVSHGHLFDPHNSASLWSIYLQKFRTITVRWGEDVGGTPYWQNAGVFLVTETRVEYEKDRYPTIRVVAEDMRVWWDENEITTDYYQATPESILPDVVNEFGGLATGDIVIPSIFGSYVVWQQWIETTLKEVIEDICNRFGYYPRITVDNDFSIRRIDFSAGVDHDYSDLTKITGFTPDDSFSDFTNRVVVVGESRGFLEVTFNEEQIGTVSGTGGWWGGADNHTIWYSEDKARKCRNPRLVVNVSVKSSGWLKGGGGEEISYVDPDEKYCIVTITSPDLRIQIIAAFAAIIAAAAALGGSSWNPFSGTATGLGLGAAIVAALVFMGSVSNYSSTVYAQPLGRERQMFQAEANDYELQTSIGNVITKKIEDTLCIDSSMCQAVANYELSIVQAQRRRIRFSKIAHLQDEEGDIIQINHPYGGQPMRIYVTDLTRKMKMGQGGYFLDEIEGWRLV